MPGLRLVILSAAEGSSLKKFECMPIKTALRFDEDFSLWSK